MSRHETVSLACPTCGRDSPFTRWSSLNVTLDPDQKPRLRSGELFGFTCQHCGATAGVVTSMLYHDMQRQAMVWLVPEGGQPPADGSPLLIRGMGGYLVRWVTSRNALVEKIAILDADLSDVVIELAKRVLPSQLPAEMRANLAEVRFDGIEPGEGGERLAFVILTTSDPPARMMVPRAFYDDVDRDLSPARKRPPGPWPRVDETTIDAIAPGPEQPVGAAPRRHGLLGRLFQRG